MPFPVHSIHVERAAQKLGILLPSSYVEYLQRSNGGEVETADDDWQLFPVMDDSDRTRLKRTANDIVRETQVARGWPNFPDGAVAIASNGAGDKLVLLPNESGERLADAVFLWDHETGLLTDVATDFGELIGG